MQKFKNLLKGALLLIVMCAFFVSEAIACTTFCLKRNGEVLFGKNYDWSIGDGMIFVNKRGISKTADQKNNPAKWVSKYGSLTFNQYGRENPSGGINEMGLVIELMWLDDTKYPAQNSLPTIGTLEWIQYQLDNSATVEEVIKNSEKIRIAEPTPLHYLVNDKSGNSATIEFLEGKLVAHTGTNLPVAALANDTYKKSLDYAKNFEKSSNLPSGQSSFDRFTRASVKVKEFSKTEKNAVEYAFEMLGNVAQGEYTQWSIVYDQKNGKIFYRTKMSPAIKSIDAKSFDYSCSTPVKMLDVNDNKTGDVTSGFADYTRQANRNLIERSFNGTDFLHKIPSQIRDNLAQIPETFPCDGKPEVVVSEKPVSEPFALYQVYLIAKSIGLI